MIHRTVIAAAVCLFALSFAHADDASAIRLLQAEGATVDRDETQPGKPVRLVSYNLRQITADGNRALKEITELPEIEFIGSGDSEITTATLKALQGKSSLKRFTVAYATISDEAAKVLASLKSLTELHLKVQIECSATALAEILKMKNLKELTISDRLVNDETLEAVGKLTELKVLNVRSIFVTDQGIASLKRLKNLQTLRIFLGPDVKPMGLRNLGDLSPKQLEVTYFNVSDANLDDLAEVRGLTTLRLMNASKVTDAAIPSFVGMRDLKELEIIGGKYTKKQIEELKRKLPGCKISEGIQ